MPRRRPAARSRRPGPAPGRGSDARRGTSPSGSGAGRARDRKAGSGARAERARAGVVGRRTGRAATQRTASPTRPVPARAWLRHLARHVPVAVAGEDPEGVHQVRVAAGRVAVWLELGGRAVLRDDLRTLRRSAAAVRDCDVLLARGVPDVFAARLRERREHARAEMLAHLRGPHARALRQALALLPSLPRPDAEASLVAFRDRVLRRGDALAAARDPHDEVFHALRRAVRKLRYALEWLGRDSAPVKRLQQTFGDLNDTAVEIRLLEETRAAAECALHARRLRSRLLAERREALRAWRASREGIAALGREARP